MPVRSEFSQRKSPSCGNIVDLAKTINMPYYIAA